MSRPLTTVLILGTFLVPACAIYDAELLEQAVGGDGDGSGNSPGSGGGGGGGGGDGDGDGDSGGNSTTGGMNGGDGDGDSGGGTGMGGTGGDGAGGVSGDGGGGSSDGGTGGMGTGGTNPGECDVAWGTTDDFTETASIELLDDFETPWNKFADNDTYTGQWNPAFDPDGEGASPTTDDWVYETDPCSLSSSLHIVGTGYTAWGASIDANLMLNNDTIALPFDGVGFWARSPEINQIRIGFADDVGQEDSSEKLITAKWQQFLVPFPADVDKTKMKVIKLNIIADETIDVWIDDVVFYVKE